MEEQADHSKHAFNLRSDSSLGVHKRFEDIFEELSSLQKAIIVIPMILFLLSLLLGGIAFYYFKTMTDKKVEVLASDLSSSRARFDSLLTISGQLQDDANAAREKIKQLNEIPTRLDLVESNLVVLEGKLASQKSLSQNHFEDLRGDYVSLQKALENLNTSVRTNTSGIGILCSNFDNFIKMDWMDFTNNLTESSRKIIKFSQDMDNLKNEKNESLSLSNLQQVVRPILIELQHAERDASKLVPPAPTFSPSKIDTNEDAASLTNSKSKP